MKKYLITSPDIYTSIPANFKENLSRVIDKHQPEYILFRDKENENYKELAQEFISTCKKYKNIKSFLHQDVQAALDLGADGVHLTSLQFDEIQKAKENSLEVIISTHRYEEVTKAQNLGADAVTYSPIFHSPNKGKPKGIKDLKKLLEQVSIKVFALGGIIGEVELEQLRDLDVYGFASIRYFEQ